MSNISSSAFADTKAHYDLLDGLRGVAALMVIWYHIFEGYAFAEVSNSAIWIKGLIMVIWPSIFSLFSRASLSVMRMTTVGVRV